MNGTADADQDLVATEAVESLAPPTSEPAAAPATGRRGARTVWRSVGKSAGARILVLPVSALLGIVVTRLVIENYGTAAFGQYGLLVGIGTLLPFADLGISAAIMNVVAQSENPRDDDRLRRTLITSLRLLTLSAAVIVLVSVIITLLGIWPLLLGGGLDPVSGPAAAAWCLALIGITVPLGVGQRILSGLGRNHVTVLTVGLQTPIVLLVLVAMVTLGLPGGGYVAVVAFAATLVLSIATTLAAARMITPTLGRAVRAAPRLRTVRGAPVFSTAWPMLIQMIALPIAMQTDRLVLSHVGRLAELPRYNLASQMFTPIWAVTSAAGVALWPIFAKDRARGRRDAGSAFRMSLVFAGTAALVAVVVALCSGLLARLASGGAITLPVGLLVAFAVLMVFQAAKYPLGMFLTDPPGLRFQAYMILAMLPVNLGLSIALAVPLGAMGPVIGSAIGVGLFQVLANALYVRRTARRQALTPSTAPAADD
ncbi:O-antigen/teichoic acid export membrane protein [Friedmanniella endophytica]|uniref:O-antigen/teichoic acid export membrane protein n=1 Tax=Microlunatus kandeliicorticis TaxID=1759536 RepID=A0A7W3P4A7_9ACTN|nr:polysaccharide biosynthesis protein [Microlunatus kandeliicorticis]MBA8792672.1 O-antigen/teichoic acid export membrane protein [Microlunatus kandeliicorticis]